MKRRVGIVFGDAICIHFIHKKDDVKWTLDDICFATESDKNAFVSLNNDSTWTPSDYDCPDLKKYKNLNLKKYKNLVMKIYDNRRKFEFAWTSDSPKLLRVEEYLKVERIGTCRTCILFRIVLIVILFHSQ